MAVSTINPWAAGAVVFDQRPWQAFYERQALREQAKNDALDKYFQDLGKNVTSSGMRSQDVPTFLKKNQEWQQYYQQNKSAILNPKLDNGKAYTEYMRGYQDQLGLANESKAALKTMDEIGKLRLNPQTSYVADDPMFIEQIQKHELPIGDPNRAAINLATLALPDKPIDTKERDAYRKYLAGDLKPDEIPGETKFLPGFKTETPIVKQFSQENLRVIGQRAMDAYDTDRRWRKDAVKIFKDIMYDPNQYEQLNNVFKSIYGNDIDSPREARAAADMLANKIHSTEYKQGEDVYGRSVALQKLRHADAKDLLRYKKQIDPNDTEMNNLWVENYLGQLTKEALAKKPVEYKYQGGAKVEEYNIPVDPVLGKALAEGNVTPDAVRVDKDGNFRRIFFKRYGKDEKEGFAEGEIKMGADGKIAVDEVVSRQKLTPNQVALALGYRGQTKKQLEQTMQSALGKKNPKEKYPLPSGKPMTVVQGGFTYTYNPQTGEYE